MSENTQSGYIYCLSNLQIPGVVYVGATTRRVEDVLRGTNSLPFFSEDERLANFTTEWSERVSDIWAVDDTLRARLDHFLDETGPGYFRCTPDEAHKTLRDVLQKQSG